MLRDERGGPMFTGSIVATVTPMKDGELDERSLRGLLRMHAEHGTAGIVPAGCTGEAATLTSEERLRMLAVCLDEVGDSMPVIPGTGSNSTRETIHHTKAAEAAGAHGALIITPYYNKPTPEGLYQHYRAVALETGLPIVLYNVPSRTGVNMTPETVARLSEIENIVAVKEAAGSVDQVSEIAELCDITILSGDDPQTLPMMSVGAKGVVSVVANVLPALVSEMVAAYPGRPARAAELHHQLRPISKALFVETSPGPIKYMMSELGLLESAELRAPLVGVTDQTKQKMAGAIAAVREARG
jgi:4-hydroxy-tetrahydrodipicolinate synthase